MFGLHCKEFPGLHAANYRTPQASSDHCFLHQPLLRARMRERVGGDWSVEGASCIGVDAALLCRRLAAGMTGLLLFKHEWKGVVSEAV